MSALATVLAAGLRIEPAGDRLRVSPASKLTPELERLIREHKAELLQAAKDAERARQVVGADRFCWPHSDAANTAELALMEKRLARFARLHIPIDKAEAITDVLLIRDRDQDDRRLCIECRHGQGKSCPGGAPLPGVLQRCRHFSEPSL